MQTRQCYWCLDVIQEGTAPATFELCDRCKAERFPTRPEITEGRIVRESTPPKNREGRMFLILLAFSRYILISG